MCGIVGRVGFRTSAEQAENILRKQLKAISFRGPDANGVSVKDGVAFGHVRLSIIDLSSGSQPMSASDGRFQIVFNGEIYNYIELKAELERDGVSFLTASDTEVLLEAFRKWGKDCLGKLNGMFSFALFDFQKRELFCARDPYGQKPFFYLEDKGELHFASETRAFFAGTAISKEIRPDALAQYLTTEALWDDLSIFHGVKKLPPGHSLIWKQGKCEVERYYKSVPAEIPNECSLNDAIEQADVALLNAVRLSIRADVPVGILLSGGLDSSLVLAYFKKVLPEGKIQAFHAQMDDPTYDESIYARQAANAIGVDLNVFKLGLEELGALAKIVPTLLDEPQADPGILPKYFICREIAKTYKVALTGDGSDELFYGYLLLKAQQLAKYYRFVPNWIHKGIVAPLARGLPTRSGYMRTDFLAKQFVRGFPSTDALRASNWMHSFSRDELRGILRNSGSVDAAADSADSFLNEIWAEVKKSGYIGQLGYRMQRTYLPDYVLCNSDRASMLNSLELRSPILDPNVAALANSLPDSYKMRGMQTKFLLKKVAERHLPRSVIYRKKIGFTIPMAEILRTSLKADLQEVFTESLLKKQGIFDYGAIRRVMDSHFSREANLYKPLWTLYSLQKWLIHEGFC